MKHAVDINGQSVNTYGNYEKEGAVEVEAKEGQERMRHQKKENCHRADIILQRILGRTVFFQDILDPTRLGVKVNVSRKTICVAEKPCEYPCEVGKWHGKEWPEKYYPLHSRGVQAYEEFCDVDECEYTRFLFLRNHELNNLVAIRIKGFEDTLRVTEPTPSSDMIEQIMHYMQNDWLCDCQCERELFAIITDAAGVIDENTGCEPTELVRDTLNFIFIDEKFGVEHGPISSVSERGIDLEFMSDFEIYNMLFVDMQGCKNNFHFYAADGCATCENIDSNRANVKHRSLSSTKSIKKTTT
jgi:hypothetical protein